MGNPFQDQLLKAGLVNKKQVKKAQHEKRASRQQNKGTIPEMATSKAREEQEAQVRRNKELNRQRLEEKRQREQKAQVKQLIEDNRLARDERGDPYNFVELNKIKRIFVSAEMAEQLSRGQLAIVKVAATYEVVLAKVARQIAHRDPEAVAAFHEGSP